MAYKPMTMVRNQRKKELTLRILLTGVLVQRKGVATDAFDCFGVRAGGSSCYGVAEIHRG